MAAARITLDRPDQTDLLVVPQRGLAEPAAPGHILDRESCHADSKPNLKRFKSSPSCRLCLVGCPPDGAEAPPVAGGVRGRGGPGCGRSIRRERPDGPRRARRAAEPRPLV